MEIPVRDGALTAIRFGTGKRVILAVHGITGSGMSFRAVGKRLPEQWSLVAVDLRGRGGSSDVPGPYGIDAHAEDIVAAAEFLGAPVVLTGHSMGAFIALRAAARKPELFSRLVMIDGGLPLPVPAGADPAQVLEQTVGPALDRLRMSFPDRASYVDLFRKHPAMAGEWNADIAAYAEYDIAEADGAVRSRVNSDAVYTDGRDLLIGQETIGRNLDDLTVAATLLYADGGMLGDKPGLLPQALVDTWTARTSVSAELIENSNHYTILMTEKPAEVIAARLTA